jgi:hypothetical protein
MVNITKRKNTGIFAPTVALATRAGQLHLKMSWLKLCGGPTTERP